METYAALGLNQTKWNNLNVASVYRSFILICGELDFFFRIDVGLFVVLVLPVIGVFYVLKYDTYINLKYNSLDMGIIHFCRQILSYNKI